MPAPPGRERVVLACGTAGELAGEGHEDHRARRSDVDLAGAAEQESAVLGAIGVEIDVGDLAAPGRELRGVAGSSERVLVDLERAGHRGRSGEQEHGNSERNLSKHVLPLPKS